MRVVPQVEEAVRSGSSHGSSYPSPKVAALASLLPRRGTGTLRANKSAKLTAVTSTEGTSATDCLPVVAATVKWRRRLRNSAA
ncbi:hypothetical protein [Dendronalium sp. ChiSLP03b]|uniref:hypothetical protein n=1 Tax=Dendronalium sp. ChiSLP03b TaxID=3075381 RepID=UPI00391C6230